MLNIKVPEHMEAEKPGDLNDVQSFALKYMLMNMKFSNVIKLRRNNVRRCN